MLGKICDLFHILKHIFPICSFFYLNRIRISISVHFFVNKHLESIVCKMHLNVHLQETFIINLTKSLYTYFRHIIKECLFVSESALLRENEIPYSYQMSYMQFLRHLNACTCGILIFEFLFNFHFVK